MKREIAVFIIILILALLGMYGYLTNPNVQKTIASYTEEDFSENNIYSDLPTLAVRLEEEIMKGSDSFTVYLKNMDVDAIDQINNSLDGVFGSGSTYQQIGTVGNTYKKVSITIKRTTNYYVWKHYVAREPIPETEQKAKQLYEIVEKIMSECVRDSMSDYEKELALHDYLIRNCQYSKNTAQPSGSDIYRAYGALVNGDAVCNGYAEALQLLFACAGLESHFVIGTADGVEHAWNLVKVDGEWYHLDATWNDPLPDQGNQETHSYFNVSDEVMSASHQWDGGSYPKAMDMRYNFYVYQDLYFENFDEYKNKAYETMVGEGQNRYEAVMRSYVENEDDMQFIFMDNQLYNSVNWQTHCAPEYNVLILQAE